MPEPEKSTNATSEGRADGATGRAAPTSAEARGGIRQPEQKAVTAAARDVVSVDRLLEAKSTEILYVEAEDLRELEELKSLCTESKGQSFRALVWDVRRRGITTPCDVTPEGVIIDGHTRVRAAKEVGCPVPVRVFADDDLTVLVKHGLASNLLRRHSSAEGRARVVARVEVLYQRGKIDLSPEDDCPEDVDPGSTSPDDRQKRRGLAGKLIGMSGRQYSRHRALSEKDEEIQEAYAGGLLTLKEVEGLQEADHVPLVELLAGASRRKQVKEWIAARNAARVVPLAGVPDEKACAKSVKAIENLVSRYEDPKAAVMHIINVILRSFDVEMAGRPLEGGGRSLDRWGEEDAEAGRRGLEPTSGPTDPGGEAGVDGSHGLNKGIPPSPASYTDKAWVAVRAVKCWKAGLARGEKLEQIGARMGTPVSEMQRLMPLDALPDEMKDGFLEDPPLQPDMTVQEALAVLVEMNEQGSEVEGEPPTDEAKNQSDLAEQEGAEGEDDNEDAELEEDGAIGSTEPASEAAEHAPDVSADLLEQAKTVTKRRISNVVEAIAASDAVVAFRDQHQQAVGRRVGQKELGKLIGVAQGKISGLLLLRRLPSELLGQIRGGDSEVAQLTFEEAKEMARKVAANTPRKAKPSAMTATTTGRSHNECAT